MPPITTTVMKNPESTPAGEVSPGASASIPETAGITVTGMSMSTVPDTVGVRMRWKRDSRQASTRGTSAETATSVASVAGPLWVSALMQAGMKAPEVPMTMTCPAPIRPARTACNMVVRPQIVTEASTAQDAYDSEAPAARMTTIGISMTAAMFSTASWRPYAEGERGWRCLVGLVANAGLASRAACAHEPASNQWRLR